MDTRTPYQSGYEDAQDRGQFASGAPRPEDMHEYLRGYRDGEAALESRDQCKGKKKFAYLDKGFVELMDWMGSDRDIAEAAWVSSDKAEDRSHDDVIRVVRYMAKHNHWTPFGQTAIKLRFRIPIFVARQLMRSNIGIVWNEESRRYVDSLPEFHVPHEWRERSTSMKQGSGGPFKELIDYDDRSLSATDLMHEAYRSAISVYAAMIDAGVAPEQARIVLPVATYTTIVGTFNVASLARVHGLRADPHAQAEIQALAKCIDACVTATRAFPAAWEALKEFGA